MGHKSSLIYSDPHYLRLHEFIDAENASSEARAVFKLCHGQAGEKWLDVCCGFGRHVEELARLGCSVVGLDQSTLMLARAATRAHERKQRLSYVLGDICHIPFTDQFDTVSLLFDSFGFFPDDLQHFDALLSIGFSLKPHGTFLIHLNNRERLLGQWKDRVEEHHGDYVISRDYWRDLPRGRYGWRESVFSPAGSHEWNFDLRMFTAPEISELLVRAGFDQIEFYGSLEGATYDVDSACMLVKARKMVFSDIPSIPD